MIIKFCVDKCWQMFDEVDSLQYRYLGDTENIVCRDDVLDYTNRPIAEDEAMTGRVELLFMNKNQLEPSQVIACRPIYLLNNDGRTIEKL